MPNIALAKVDGSRPFARKNFQQIYPSLVELKQYWEKLPQNTPASFASGEVEGFFFTSAELLEVDANYAEKKTKSIVYRNIKHYLEAQMMLTSKDFALRFLESPIDGAMTLWVFRLLNEKAEQN